MQLVTTLSLNTADTIHFQGNNISYTHLFNLYWLIQIMQYILSSGLKLRLSRVTYNTALKSASPISRSISFDIAYIHNNI